DILLKPGKLDPAEWATMQTHTTIGASILSGSRSELVQLAEQIALSHHERWDGGGYPQGLEGDQIPLAARICAVCDVFDALLSPRPYKDAWPLGDVIGELAAMTPGPYLHVGGDEAHSTSDADYVLFMNKVRDIVEANGKTLMGWAEVAQANPLPGSIAQNWTTATGSQSGGNLAREAVAKGMKVVMSPANRIYLDMKYAPGVPPNLGLSWAGFVEVQRAYDWNPGTHLTGVTDANILGVEAALWSETVTNIDDAEMLAFPRMAGAAEIGWTPQAGRSWDDYRIRLAGQAERWDILGVDFYRSPQVPWPTQ
ncbi:MAG: family 20 glycosylhydrolase, partial [Nocardioidaceae bacterium]